MPRSYAHCCNRGVDFTPTASDRVLPDETPIIVVLHGLTGGSYTHPNVVLTSVPNTPLGSQESYIRALLAPAVLPVEQGGLGYRAVVVNFRGCMPSIYSSKVYATYGSNQAQEFHSQPRNSIHAVIQTISAKPYFISRISILGPRY